MTLSDAHVLLRPWTPADVPAKLMAFADPSIVRFSWPHSRAYTEDDARAFFAAQREATDELNVAIADPADPAEVRGGASLYAIDRGARTAAIGYWLAPQARGRGLATRATRLLIGWAFSELQIVRLELTCGPDNIASQRVAERCGFALEGLLRSHIPFKGARRDSLLYALLDQADSA